MPGFVVANAPPGGVRMQRHGCQAEFVQADVLGHDRPGHYDVVVVNFFLNVFSPTPMRDMLAYLVTLVRPGRQAADFRFRHAAGQFDFARHSGSVMGRDRSVLLAARSVAWHPIYDYASYFPDVGLERLGEKRFRPYKVGPGGFTALTALRHGVTRGPGGIVRWLTGATSRFRLTSRGCFERSAVLAAKAKRYCRKPVDFLSFQLPTRSARRVKEDLPYTFARDARYEIRAARPRCAPGRGQRRPAAFRPRPSCARHGHSRHAGGADASHSVDAHSAGSYSKSHRARASNEAILPPRR